MNTNSNYISLLYVKGLFEQVYKMLSRYKVKMAHKPNNATKTFSNFKPKIKKQINQM